MLTAWFARSRGLEPRFDEQILYGGSLSLHWRGSPHAYRRSEPQLANQRRQFEANASTYDALVVTETVPVSKALHFEHTTLYLRRYYCRLVSQNPNGRVFLYEGWLGISGSSSGRTALADKLYDWRSEMIAERASWEQLAATAAPDGRPTVTGPSGPSRGLRQRVSDLFMDRSWSRCETKSPILIIPVGTALLALSARLAAPRAGDDFSRPNGHRIAFEELFVNALVADDAGRHWRQDGVSPVAASRSLKPRDPHQPLDDIHLSALGFYYASLVTYAVLFGQNPLGLPATAEIGPRLARTLQCVAGETLRDDPRAGVAGRWPPCA